MKSKWQLFLELATSDEMEANILYAQRPLN